MADGDKDIRSKKIIKVLSPYTAKVSGGHLPAPEPPAETPLDPPTPSEQLPPGTRRLARLLVSLGAGVGAVVVGGPAVYTIMTSPAAQEAPNVRPQAPSWKTAIESISKAAALPFDNSGDPTAAMTEGTWKDILHLADESAGQAPAVTVEGADRRSRQTIQTFMPAPVADATSSAQPHKPAVVPLEELVNRTADGASLWASPTANSKMTASQVILVSSELRHESAAPQIVLVFNSPLDAEGKELLAEFERLAAEQHGAPVRQESEGKGTLAVTFVILGTALAAVKILEPCLLKAMELCVTEATLEDGGAKLTWKKLGRPRDAVKMMEQMRARKIVIP